ncbi:N-acetylmuramoyl-L-alanine amidase [Paenibacillus sp. FSL A5-0031]|uniref:N-acetylmuramoyl-L-alanine amidase family protein n=1 Tax=Paenibacillus sp. FSL A5-0031 TaxID=1920420 RepID=UPI00096C4E1F|nr:N-acetylmuramoyl-L-alanine amidase [Paenibacillus sp. FSL A5-0031]OME78207.1 N-acetylmuramoyl-L-alanine amidase [Paenibacillus sp. FSL A5-0031]
MFRKMALTFVVIWLAASSSSSSAFAWPLLPVGNNQDWALPSTVVIIDAGHGGIDGGASSADILEKDINLAVARKLYFILRSQNIPAVLNRTGDYALSDDNRWHNTRSRHRKDLSQRRQLTDEIESELLISLHVNWSKKSMQKGPLVLHQSSGESSLLAFCIQDALNRQQNTAFLPREGKPFYLLRRVQDPAVIVEMGFISSEHDRTMLTDPQRQQEVAEAIASGIRQYKWIVH